MKRVIAILLLFAFTGALAGQAPAPQAAPRLIVVISIDQMRYDYLSRFAPIYKGGFKTLLDRAAVFTNALYRHANSETGPGHAVILSGRHASSSGIVANSWYDPLLKKMLNVVDDPAQGTVGGPGRSASPSNFVGFGVTDKIKQKWSAARVVGVSMKDRSAILTAGHRADAAFWFENACGCFITSTYYMKQPPAWLVEFNRLRLADKYYSAPWTKLINDDELYRKYSSEDNFPGEWDLKDTTFPHAHRGKPPEAAYYDNLRRTPFADEILLQVVMEVLKAYDLGAGPEPDVLAVGFSAGDVIGHTYGPFSQEAMDNYLRLDLVLDKLFKAIDARAGLSNTLVILTADHGVLPLPEWLQKQGIQAKRVRGSMLVNAVKQALKERFPSAPELVAGVENLNFSLNLEAIERAGLKRSDVEQTAIRALMATGAVAAVYTYEDMYSEKHKKDPWALLFRNSFFPPRSPHLMVVQKQYYYISSEDRPGGSGHGSVHEYDRHVPVVWMGAGIRPGRYAAAAGPEDIAPTLARMLGINDYPLEHDSRLLTEVLPGAVLSGNGSK